MGLFGARAGSPESVLRLVDRLAPGVFPGSRVDRGDRRLLVPVPGGSAGVNLDGLLAQAAESSDEQQEFLVRSWLSDLVPQLRSTPVPDPAGIAPAPADLRLRVMPKWEEQALAGVASSPVPFGFDAVVAYPDAAGRPAYLPAASAQAHFGGAEQAVMTAVGNTAPAELRDLRVTDRVVDGHALRLVDKPGNPFVTTTLLTVKRFLPEGSSAGALVIAPGYSEVILRGVARRSDVDAVPMLTAMARERLAGAADPCSPLVYWWHEGTYWVLDSDPGGRVVFPAQLQPVVESLGR